MSEKTNEERALLSTGEIAKSCGVTVRTVQYYDARGLLRPSELTEGGRRMYSDEDVKKLRLLCYLRTLGLSIDNISKIFAEENAGKVIDVLLEEQIRSLDAELIKTRDQLKEARGFLSQIRSSESCDRESIQDMAYYMESRKKLNKLYRNLIIMAVPLGLVCEAAPIVCLILTGVWWPLVVGIVIAAVAAFFMARYSHKRVAYICPECHGVFKPNMKEFFFAAHTLRTRKLTCPECGKKSYCIETYSEDKR